MNRLELFVPGTPIPQGSKRAILSRSTQRPIVVDANRIGLADWRASITATVMRHMADNSLDKHIGPVGIHLQFFLKRPEQHWLPVNSKRDERELRPTAPLLCATAPDIDKLIRAVLDALTDAGAWYDDGQVAAIRAIKVYASEPGEVGVQIITEDT